MIVVSDTTPIISLMKVGKLNLLKEMYGEVVIPFAVYDELTCNAAMAKEIITIEENQFLRVNEVDNHFAVNLLREQMNLGAGESEAIALAKTTDHIINIKPILDEMIAQNIRISDRLYDEIFTLVDESK